MEQRGVGEVDAEGKVKAFFFGLALVPTCAVILLLLVAIPIKAGVRIDRSFPELLAGLLVGLVASIIVGWRLIG